MARDLLDSLEVIRLAAEDIRREQWSWEHLRETQKLRWRPTAARLAVSPQLRDVATSGRDH